MKIIQIACWQALRRTDRARNSIEVGALRSGHWTTYTAKVFVSTAVWAAWIGLAMCLALTLGQSASAQVPRSLAEAFPDAELNDVSFLDSDRGWAVGERGIIWQTEDGGRTWKRQESISNARWEAIQFLDEKTAWIVGGSIQAYTQKSGAAIAQSRDGGKSWKMIPAATIPSLKTVRFTDERRGWAAGSGSAMYPAGLFRTEDGGRSWTPLTNLPNQGWQTLDVRDARGVLMGRYGERAFLQLHTAKLATPIPVGLQQSRKVMLDRDNHGWLVGDRGLILESNDAGGTWKPPAGLPSHELLREIDFSSLAVVGEHCWLAGAPGSCILHSADGGKNWELQLTGQSLPLRALTFLDERRGWAVGSLGTILATRDGGRTWSRQRGGGTRAAVLGVFCEAERVPWEWCAQLFGNDGYLGALELLYRRDVELPSRGEVSAEDRVREALMRVNGSAVHIASEFPRRQAGLQLPVAAILENWVDADGRPALVALEDHLVKKIRQWRPDVVLTEEASRTEADPIVPLLQQVLQRALQRAGTFEGGGAPLMQLGLEPWKAKKALAVGVGEQSGSINLNTSQLAPRLGKTLSDAAASSRGLVQDRFEPSPASYSARVLASHIGQDVGRREIMSGIALAPDSEARRPQDASLAGDMKELNRAAQQQRIVQQLMNKTMQDASSGANWLAQIDNLTRGMRKEAAGELLYQLSHRYFETGKMDLAIETMNVLVDRHPDHELAGAALTWLIQISASSEVALRLPEAAKVSSQKLTAIAPSAEDKLPAVRLTSDQSPVEHAVAPAAGRDVQTLSLGKKLERLQPVLFARPSLRFPLLTVQRRGGQTRDVEAYLRNLAGAGASDVWGQCAAAELNLGSGKAIAKAVYTCDMAKSKPKLDGLLDDEVWQRSKKMELRSTLLDDGEWPATVSISRDDEFLYIAAICQKAPGIAYPPSDSARPRDPDLRDRDRMEVLIDLDRDYTSFFHLEIDYRGWVAESCFGDASWNPTWYVATKDANSQWSFEAAIPLKELTNRPLSNKDVWAVGVQRVTPGVGFQSWTQPAGVKIRPEGFGWLMFE